MKNMNVLGKLNTPLASYSLSLNDMIQRGEYDIVDPHIYDFKDSDFDKAKRYFRNNLFLTFFELKQYKRPYVLELIDVNSILNHLEIQGMRVSGLFDLLSFGISHPNVQKGHQIIALKDFIILNDQKYYPFLTGVVESSDRILGIIPEQEMMISEDISFLVSF